jgi:hypothetical protein
VALQAVENVAWENEQLQDEVDAARRVKQRVAELEAAARDTEARHAAEMRAAAQARDVAAKQAKLEADVTLAERLEQLAAEHVRALEHGESLRKVVR